VVKAGGGLKQRKDSQGEELTFLDSGSLEKTGGVVTGYAITITEGQKKNRT